MLLSSNFIFIASDGQQAPEICDNALDDDNDGLIDLNDDDCQCEPLEQPSFISNPSFEEQACCPPSFSRLDCAQGWIQASEGTTDYYHPCDFGGTDMLDVPQPIPDGEGFAGFIDGSVEGQVVKEYLGTCLRAPLIPDTLYRIEFYTGFMDRSSSPDIDIALFGTADCANLPFGIGDRAFGCPANSPEWVQLGSVGVSGENQWVKSQFKVRVPFEITAIAFGPSCRLRSTARTPYHFVDQLVLKENSNFDLGIKVTGQPCTDDLTFTIRAQEGYQYQWYKNGVAIPRAVGNSLRNPPGRGQYQVRLENSEGCKISGIHNYTPPDLFEEIGQTICAGERLPFRNQQLTDAGIYWDTLTSANYCDSIVRLELKVNQAIETTLSTKIFPGETFRIGPRVIERPGEYSHTIPAASGCDSTVHLQLGYYAIYIPNAFSPNGDAVNDVFSIYVNADLKEVSSLSIFDRWGVLVYYGKALLSEEGWDGTINGREAPVGAYVYSAELLMADDKTRAVRGMLTLVR